MTRSDADDLLFPEGTLPDEMFVGVALDVPVDRPVDEKSADFLGRGTAAGLPRLHDVQTLRLQGARQQIELRRFAGPFPAFERDKLASRHGRQTLPVARTPVN